MPPSNSIADELTKFAKLRDQGIITEEEFNQLKSKIIMDK
ncbi:MAG TPA: SHOCT domain-containing protein [Nitrososphaeraceae archaeon]|nr:SHOCT domain-containing protein [Nitrososphaeraceae archaeon]